MGKPTRLPDCEPNADDFGERFSDVAEPQCGSTLRVEIHDAERRATLKSDAFGEPLDDAAESQPKLTRSVREGSRFKRLAIGSVLKRSPLLTLRVSKPLPFV